MSLRSTRADQNILYNFTFVKGISKYSIKCDTVQKDIKILCKSLHSSRRY